MHIDLIISHARIRTGWSQRPTASAVGVWQGLIVGFDEQLHGMTAEIEVDARGAFMMAGFNDAHAHSVWYGQTLSETDLTGAADRSQVYEKIAQESADDSDDSDGSAWLIAAGFDPLALEAPLELDALDRAARGRPLLIKHASGHAYTVNGVALEAVGIGRYPHARVDGGVIATDEEGRATGLLEENAMRPVQDVLQPDPLLEISRALDRATTAYARQGLTSVTDAGVGGGWIGHSPREFAAYQDARERRTLSTRTQAMIASDVFHPIRGHRTEEAFAGLDAGIRCGLGDDRLQIGPMKLFVDGSLLGGTAAVTEPYCGHDSGHGYLQGDPDAMAATITGAVHAGWAIATHAIGDRGLDLALDMLERATAESHRTPPMPHRIEHGGVVRPDQLPRIKSLGAALVPQPMFIAAYGDGMAEKLGDRRTLLSYPAASVLRAGITLPGSSDRPVAEGAPLRVIQSFVERTTQTGRDYGPDERITVDQALSAYTTGSARATGWAACKGHLAPGMLADFVVLSADPRHVPTDAIGRIGVLSTWVGGECTFTAEQPMTG